VKRRIPATVIALGVVSLLTDLSSEMIYPLLPIFLTTVLHAGTIALGLIEGIAELTASVLKVFSGYVTDRTGKRKGLVFAGYTLSTLSKPLIGIATTWQQVLILRFLDRTGKGIRTSPRDTLIADVTEKGIIGRAYGVHRAMDHAGAVIGPLVAVYLLKFVGLSIRSIFLLSIIPGVMVILTLKFFVKESYTKVEKPRLLPEENSEVDTTQRNFYCFLVALVIFTLGNSTDAFLILRLAEEGIDISTVAFLWAAFHVVKMFTNYIGGRLVDRFGPRIMVFGGWLFYAVVYLLFALLEGKVFVLFLFLVYGLYYGISEPAERAWVYQVVPLSKRGRAFGLYHASVGMASLPASLIFGILWRYLGYKYAFALGGLLAIFASVFYIKSTRSY
jgi:MFS family permease